MSRKRQEAEWLDSIADSACVEKDRVNEFLARHRILSSPVPVRPRRLTLRRIRFSGEKSGDNVPDPPVERLLG